MSENHVTFSLIHKWTKKYGEITDELSMTSATTHGGDWSISTPDWQVASRSSEVNFTKHYMLLYLFTGGRVRWARDPRHWWTLPRLCHARPAQDVLRNWFVLLLRQHMFCFCLISKLLDVQCYDGVTGRRRKFSVSCTCYSQSQTELCSQLIRFTRADGRCLTQAASRSVSPVQPPYQAPTLGE